MDEISSKIESKELNFEEQLDALKQIEQLKNDRDEYLKLKLLNSPASVSISRKEHENNKKNLKSDLKKTTAFVKKIKTITAEGLQQCIREVEQLNLTLYVSEIVSAILETTYKPSDIPALIILCVCLHRRYEEFTQPFLLGIRTFLISQNVDEDPKFGQKKRICIRLIIELFKEGVVINENYFVELLKSLLGKSKHNTPPDYLGLSTYLKYGTELLFGFPSKKMEELSLKSGIPIDELPSMKITSSKVSDELRSMVDVACKELCSLLVKAHKDYRSKDKKANKDLLIHGTLSDAKQLELDNAKKLFEKIFTTVTDLSNNVGFDIPILEEDKDDENTINKGLTVWDSGIVANNEYGPYGDSESRQFYEDLPDLLSLVPLAILGITSERAVTMKEEWKLAKENAYTDAGVDSIDDTDKFENEKEDNNNNNKDNEQDDIDVENKETKEDEGKMSIQTKLNLLLSEKLPECTNKQKADEFSVNYCHLHNKISKKKLIYALGRIPRNRSELASIYSRVLASLARIYPDIAEPVLDSVKREFYGIQKTKNQFAVDGKLMNIRYLGELIKFNIAPPILAFRIFKAFFADFSNTNVELISMLLETCGRFLYLLPHTHERMEEILSTMLRLRRVKNLNVRQLNMLETAYFAVKPPSVVEKVKTILTNVQKYTRYLILEKLDSSNSVDGIIKCLRKLPWNDKESNIEYYFVKACLRKSRTKIVTVPFIADCLSGLIRSCPNVIICVVDRILEEVQRGLESPHKREAQRMLGVCRLLGELYNFTVIPSTIIYDLLYHIINFGHDVPESIESSASSSNSKILISNSNRKFDPSIPSDLDAPDDLFRAQMVCDLLNTCGAYYVRGPVKDKLNRFLVYFQRYLFSKPFIPMHIEFAILDTLDNLEELCNASILNVQKKLGKKIKKKNTKQDVKFEFNFTRFLSLDAAQLVIDQLEIIPEVEEVEIEIEEKEESESESDDEEEDDEEDNNNNDDKDKDVVDDDDDDEDVDNEDEEGEDEDGEDESLSNMEATRLLNNMRIAEEDLEFEKAFKSVMQDSVSHVKKVQVISSDLSKMAIPAIIPTPKNNISHFKDEDEDDLFADLDNMNSDRKPVSQPVVFKLLSRDNKGRIESRQLAIPSDNSMSIKLAKATAIQKEEKEKLKQRVLAIERQSILEQQGLEQDTNGQDYYNSEVFKQPKSKPSLTSNSSMNNNRFIGNYNRPSPNSTNKTGDSLNLEEFLAVSNSSEIRRPKKI